MQKANYFENLTFQGGRKINISERIDEKFSDTLHWHQYAELLLSRCDGNEVVVDFTTYQLKMNDIVFVASGSLHSVHYVTPESFFLVQFPLELFTQLNEFKPVFSALSRNPMIAYDPVSQEHNEIISCLSRIRALNAAGELFYEVSIYSELLKAFLQIGLLQGRAVTSNLPANEKTDMKNMGLIAEACLYISENCTEPLTPDDVSRHIGMSKSHFSHLFRTYVDMTFVDFLTTERIKRAEGFFSDPNVHVVDVAYDSGFTSISSFNRAFRKVKGCSPTEFRRTRVD